MASSPKEPVSPQPAAPRSDALDATVVPESALQETHVVDSEQPPADAAAKSAEKEAEGSVTRKGISQLGDFKLIKKLGQGGMGEVFLAHQVSLDRRVALKTLAKQLADKPEFVERFQREARTMARLDHPHAVRVFAVHQDHGIHYVAMEYIDGQSLKKWMEQLGRLSVGDALHVILRCAEALQQAHEMQIIHRDIKPDNIMLTRKGVVKLADFGLAKAIAEDMSITESGTGLGTPFYMAPEQGRNAKHVDQRSDIYALGCTLYHLLTGKLPFSGSSTVEVLLAKEQGKFPPARRFNSEVPERLDLILDKMMARDPAHRFSKCADVIQQLTALHLDNATLSFIARLDAPTAPQPDQPAVNTQPRTAQPTAVERRKPAEMTPAAGTDQLWYVQYDDAKQRRTITRMTTAKVQQSLKTGSLPPQAKGKRAAADSFLPLAHFPEFEKYVEARLIRAKADAKTEKMKQFYADIDRQERWRHRMRKVKQFFQDLVGWASLLLWLGLIAAVLYGIYLAYPYVMQMIADYLKVG